MAEGPIGEQEIANREHISPSKTGDNIAAKRVVGYVWNGTNWQRPPSPLIDAAFDDIAFSNPDSNGNYQVINFLTGGSGGTIQRTLTLTYDSNSNVTNIART
jgi:hypothetical protein